MFTGIISACSPINNIVERNGIRVLTIALPPQWDIQIGESIAVDGVCSTIVSVTPQDFVVEYMPESLRITTLKSKQKNGIVNLERSLRLHDVVSGHLVSGHIDCVATVSGIEQDQGSHVLTITYPERFASYLISKGSGAINGISLTVVDVSETQFSVAIIPHTWEYTTLQTLVVNDSVNIEFDQVAKYIAKHLSHVGTTK
jgi:riboflavin synthase